MLSISVITTIEGQENIRTQTYVNITTNYFEE